MRIWYVVGGMATGADGGGEGSLTPAERERFGRLRSAESLADLQRATGTESPHRAYVAAKRQWYDLQEERLPTEADETFPGTTVTVDGNPVSVHGVTHAGTDAERAFLRERVERVLADGTGVYCEQGIRSLYFADVPAVCEMDDYRWAMERCRELDLDSHVGGPPRDFEGLVEDVDSLAAEFREVTFSLIEAGRPVYGETFAAALGDVASSFLTGREGLATGEDFEAFAASRRAAEDPSRLAALQRYYRKRFLPQPVERAWLRRHDRELEVVTHARNARMADYARYHADGPTHLVVGAAHQPGVAYYLRRHRDGDRDLSEFELVG